jgi:LysR family transcriptional regulator, glycine cleavage system transcriptional activator
MRRSLIPDIASLQAFECAAHHGNFTRAAEELSLTQSAISRQISSIEQQTGLVLFRRVRQRVILSEAGKRLLPEVRRLLTQSEHLMIRAVAAADAAATLNVATLPTFGSRWLMPRLPGFLRGWPSLALSVESRSAPFDFEEDFFDLAIHYGQPTWAKAVPTFLCSEMVVPVAGRRLLDATPIVQPADLEAAPLIHLTTRPRLWSEWMEMHGVRTEGGFRGSRCDQFSMIIAAAVAGIGVALLPAYLVEEEIRSGSLVLVFDLPMSTQNAYYIVEPENRENTKPAAAFKDWLLSTPPHPLGVGDQRQHTTSGIAAAKLNSPDR